ncbi:MAG TPA: ERCC4 domain-containing protein [Mycobacterium sp.]|nr:ERCC4 domain-containing protein [Mycobacterium sp.]HUH71086.1 ERCC4 domain-containing protein [Mycobacterium sp.]
MTNSRARPRRSSAPDTDPNRSRIRVGWSPSTPTCAPPAVLARSHPQSGGVSAKPAGTAASAAYTATQLQILVDTHGQYAYRFATQQATTVKHALPCGDYGIAVDGRLVAAVERKSLADLVSSLINGKLRYAVGDLAALPRAAVVVEDRYSQIFKLTWVRPSVVADGLAELQVRWPTVPIIFAETRQLAEEWTYRYLAPYSWAETEQMLAARIGMPIDTSETSTSPDAAASPSTAEIRAWARPRGSPSQIAVASIPNIWQAWREANS